MGYAGGVFADSVRTSVVECVLVDGDGWVASADDDSVVGELGAVSGVVEDE